MCTAMKKIIHHHFLFGYLALIIALGYGKYDCAIALRVPNENNREKHLF